MIPPAPEHSTEDAPHVQRSLLPERVWWTTDRIRIFAPSQTPDTASGIEPVEPVEHETPGGVVDAEAPRAGDPHQEPQTSQSESGAESSQPRGLQALQSLVSELDELDGLMGRLRVQEDTPIREGESVPETAEGEIREVQKVQATEATDRTPLSHVERSALRPDTLTFLLDTRADVTVLPAWYWDRLQRPALRKTNMVLRTANGGRLNVLDSWS